MPYGISAPKERRKHIKSLACCFSLVHTHFSQTPLFEFFSRLYIIPTQCIGGDQKDLSLCEKISQKSEGVKKVNYTLYVGVRLLLNDTPPDTIIKKKIKTRWSIVHILYRYMRSYVLVKAGPYIYGLLIPPDTVMRYISALVQQVVY